MKNNIIVIILLLAFGSQVQAQNYVCRGDTILIIKSAVRGEFYWQVSENGEDWSRIDNDSDDTLKLSSDQAGWYRFEVFEGNCNVQYSSTIKLELYHYAKLFIPQIEPVCINSEAFVLQGEEPQGGRYAGAGILDGKFIPELAGSGESKYYYIYRDSISGCTDSIARSVLVLPAVEEAIAGDDQLNIITDSVMLSANTPSLGSGIWKIIEGTGGILADSTSSSTVLYCTETSGDFLLEWTISYQCGTSKDQIRVEFVESSKNPCPDQPFVYDTDGNRYKTIQIGSQCWMAENLRVGNVISSTITNRPHSNAKDNKEYEVYAWGNDLDTLAIYGGLYDWDELMDYSSEEGGQGICPDGWHVPNRDEWQVLNKSFADNDAGAQLQITGGSGFDALMGGDRHANGDFFSFSSSAFYWTSSSYRDNQNDEAYYIEMVSCNELLQWGSKFNKKTGVSVRCIKNE